MPMSFSSHFQTSRQKRRHCEAPGEQSDIPSEEQDSSTMALHSVAFYDSLSNVWLTHRVLREYNRRTSQLNISFWSSCISQNTSKKDTSEHRQLITRHSSPYLDKMRRVGVPKRMDSSYTYHSRPTLSVLATKTATQTTRRTSPYDTNFEQHLRDHKIYVRNGKSTPANLASLQQRLTQSRSSLSPSRFSQAAFEKFQQANEGIVHESEVIRDVIPIIAGESDILNNQDLLFIQLRPIANNTIVNAKPDFFDGASLSDIDEKVRAEIGSYIIPTKQEAAAVVPNFFLEVKRPSGGAGVARRQACYNGALGARGMHRLQSYGHDEQQYDGHAYTITSTYHDGQLKLYATHLIPGRDTGNSPEYYMTQLRSFSMTDTIETFRQGATAFRNARDWAQEQRNASITAANERANSIDAGTCVSESSSHIACVALRREVQVSYLAGHSVGDSQSLRRHECGPEAHNFQSSNRAKRCTIM